jgi:endonuclease III
VVPLDVHVARIARLIGLTARTDTSWRTAREVTAALAEVDPDDPTRFDFVLAHLGISSGCRGYDDAEICPTCPLWSVCARPPKPVTRRATSRS